MGSNVKWIDVGSFLAGRALFFLYWLLIAPLFYRTGY